MLVFVYLFMLVNFSDPFSNFTLAASIWWTSVAEQDKFTKSFNDDKLAPVVYDQSLKTYFFCN